MSRRQPPPQRPDPAHYFDAVPTVGSAPRRVRVTLDDLDLDVDTDRGVFSHGRLDTGTELLLRRGGTPRTLAGEHVLDLGCGAGAIALVLARRLPRATVWAVDVNQRARDLCRANGERLGCANLRVAAPEDVPVDLQFREIWSNPPIRIGKQALHDLLSTWLDRLTADGRAVLVVQRHLGADSLATWLADEGFAVRRLASSQGYRVLDLQPRRIDDHPTA